MELVLDRKLAENEYFCINIKKSVQEEELLLSEENFKIMGF
jgi:transcription termination factor Rho